MNMDIKALHLKLLEIATDFDKYCQENGLRYFISYGTLLGAVRHKGFIPWDDDFDVVMPRKDYEKLISIFKNNDKYTLQIANKDYPTPFSKLRCNNTTFIENIPYRNKYKNIHQGVFIDIFPLDNVFEEKIKAKMQVLFSNIVITQSLVLRGYPKSHSSFMKRIFFVLAFILLPFNRLFIDFIESANDKDCKYITSFYSEVRKVYLDKLDFENNSDRLDFENTSFPVFKNYKDFLSNMYGDYMKIPSQEQIDYKIHAKFVDLENSYTDYLNNNNVVFGDK